MTDADLNINSSFTYLGGNLGFFFGNRHKVGLEVGFYNADSKNTGVLNLLTVGIGGKFKLTNN